MRGPETSPDELPAVRRSLTEIKADVKETREAMSAVANDDGALSEICLSERQASGTSW